MIAIGEVKRVIEIEKIQIVNFHFKAEIIYLFFEIRIVLILNFFHLRRNRNPYKKHLSIFRKEL